MDEAEDSLDAVIFRYTEEQAIEDGVLIPFRVNDRDTRHRITGNAYATLTGYHRERGCAEYDDPAFLRFFLNELLPLVPVAHETYRHAGILRTNYLFSVINKQQSETLWYLPNEVGGVTMMLPSDY